METFSSLLLLWYWTLNKEIHFVWKTSACQHLLRDLEQERGVREAVPLWIFAVLKPSQYRDSHWNHGIVGRSSMPNRYKGFAVVEHFLLNESFKMGVSYNYIYIYIMPRPYSVFLLSLSPKWKQLVKASNNQRVQTFISEYLTWVGTFQ